MILMFILNQSINKMNYDTKEDIALLCAKVHHNNSCDAEIWELVNTLYGFEKADKIVLAIDNKDVCLNCKYYDTTFPSGVERDEPQCLQQQSCCCCRSITRDFGCKFFEPINSVKENIHKTESFLGSNFETHKTNDGFVHIHKRAKDFTLTDTIRPTKYTLSLYTGGGDKLPTCTLCGSTMHNFSSCSNKNCIQYKGLK